ncbi:MAG: isoprenylcysteine carboxylmethyltransferase family protein [Halieaceae bacterium]|jgi:protein-S-isoprenylcysteine O-methyltransferase Ste14|nr:isoprenylcysteine carboxylmethyltransferase family protein [Halieaceae bacterium]
MTDTEYTPRPRRKIYPPAWLVIGLIVIFICDRYLPVMRFTSMPFQAAGSVSIVIGLALLVLAGGLFKQADTDLIPFRDVRALVTGGVYRFTRNPMYLGMALILLGVACTTGTVGGLLVVPLFMAIIEWRFIRPEEAMLRNLFGEEYDAYCQRVRRWL